MNPSGIFDKKITINTGVAIIGILVIFVAMLGAIYVGSWLIAPLWRVSPPPSGENSGFPASTLPAATTAPAPAALPSSQPDLTPSADPGAEATPTQTLAEILPTATSTATATALPRVEPDDWAELVSSSPSDGSYFAPLNTFTKEWTLKNVGSTTWTKDYALVFITGTRMTNIKVVPLPGTVKPGKTVKISLLQTAPKIPGAYQGLWMLSNQKGETFGIGGDGDQPLRTKITVLNVDPNNSYDFLLNYCQAEWWNSQGQTIKCPGEPKQISGFVYLSTEPVLENGSSDQPVLWVHTDKVLEGIITGRFPAYKVGNGDHFRAKVGCMSGYPNCNVTFKLLYKVDNQPNQALGSWKELYGGGITTIDVDLSALEGQTVQFLLRMTSTNNFPDSAQGFWMTPRIIYIKPTPTPTATSTLTPTPTETVEPPADTPSP